MYAVRGRDNYLYSGGDVFHEIGWFAPNSGGKAHPVEQKKCNVWGLYDMNGNVFEWVWHIKLDEPKRESKNIFKKNPHLYTKVEIIPNSHFRYTIGGSCRSNPYVHTINKSYSTYYSKLPNQRFLDTGFRLARTKLT
jgi:formylglycine-generating enzyme required for sulfatase activity